MIQQSHYNTYCTNPQCIQTRNAFFHYTKDNFHLKNNHAVEMLHPMNLTQKTKSFQQSQHARFRNDKNSLIHRVNNHISSFLQKMSVFMRQKYLEEFVTAAQSELSEIKIQNEDQIYNRLINGDYQILQEIVKGETSPTPNYPFYHYTQNRIKHIEDVVAKEIQQLYSAFQKIITVTFERKEDFLKVASGQEETLSESTKEQIKNLLKLGEASSRKSPSQPVNPMASNYNAERFNDFSEEPEYEPFSIDYCTKSKSKRKLIYKTDKKPKQAETKKPQDKKPKKPIYVASQISQVAPGQIRINSCTYAESTMQYIREKYNELSKIHIFDHKFARKETLKRLFNIYRSMKFITLNCAHQFDSSVINYNMSNQDIGKIQNLELKWDLGQFFKEYHIFKYFPTKLRQEIQPCKRTNIQLSLLIQMKNNQSLSINSDKQIQILQGSNFTFESIKTLHYTKANAVKQYPAFSKLLSFHKLRQLTTLNLTQVNLLDSERKFRQFLMSNRGITTLNIGYCKIDNYNYIFQSLKQLDNLKKFSFSPLDSAQFKPETIFRLVDLEHLHLDNTNFEIANFDNSSLLKDIGNLKKLTNLSLYACNPVFSDLFSYMDAQTLQNIEFLNVGHTQIDDSFTYFIPLMKNLEYLNIDLGQHLSGKSLVSGFKSYLSANRCASPLKYLSILSMNFTISQMKQLSIYIPYLTYIEITQCKNLLKYGFQQYKELKNLVVDKDQNRQLPDLSPSVELSIR